MKKTIKDFDLYNKKVIIRCDFNVPIKNGVITDNNRILSSLKTIKYALERGAKIILMSHLGRVKSEEEKNSKSLRPIAEELADLLKRPIKFVNNTHGELLENTVNGLSAGEILLMENTRFEDVAGNYESKNNLELGKYWSNLGDIYINDAFGTSHRMHASNVGIATNIPSGVGFLIEKELNELENVVYNPEHPFTLILGGAKVSDKIGVIDNLINKVDYFVLGGGIANTFLKAKGYNIGQSLYDIESIDYCKNLLNTYGEKLLLPVDVVVETTEDDKVIHKTIKVEDIKNEDVILDLGKETINKAKPYLEDSALIVWNGTIGMTEIEAFRQGTNDLCAIITKTVATTIVGGGDTVGAVINLGYKEKISHISTGGGAALMLLEGKKLPGIEVIDDK